MKYPALLVHGADPDFVLATVDEFAPTAVEETAGGVSIFFTSPEHRERARVALAGDLPDAIVTVRDVDDEDWARRSQQNLTPITVGRITVTPPWAAPTSSNRDAITIVISPSMGFGTGHHATTRLCLAALQAQHVNGTRVLDVGTGSGILAIAADRLGAREVLAIDVDADAVASARESLEANPEASHVRFETIDLRAAALPQADIVLANLTGAVLIQNADLLVSAVSDRGTLIVSGVQVHEREQVQAAFAGPMHLVWNAEEAGWVALAFNRA